MTRILAATAMVIVTGGAAIAQPVPPAAHHAEKVMVRGDVQAMVRTHFARMDADKDGAITTAEIAELKGAHGGPGAMMKHHRPMRDPAVAFDRLDSNKDGMISRDEFAKGREVRIERRIERHTERRERANAGMKGGQRHGMRMHRLGGGRMIVMADTNKDGRITLAEAEAMALQHFDQMDANRDGRVTPEERRAARPMMIKLRQVPKAG
ncbi:MAG: EF-hand domain-containing protein [Sphingomicrobium sp.]